MATAFVPGGFAKKPKPKGPLFGDPSTFAAAANQQAGDYDSIMNQYKDFAGSAATNPLLNPAMSGGGGKFDPITAKTTSYRQSDDVTGSLDRLKNLTDTGGYSAEDIQNIRSRNLSPINSIYASGKQNLERQRSLSGGYSPNFNAVSASMARDQASKISDITTKTNADIAQNVAQNKINIAPNYASAAAGANTTQLGADEKNTDIINDINKFNAQGKFDASKFNTNTAAANTGNILEAVKGQANLYGTTPALTNTFGNQVVQANQMSQNQQDLNQKKKAGIFKAAGFGG